VPTELVQSDEELVRRIRAGETEAFATIMRRHNARLYRVIRAIVKSDADAEDVMQQAYTSAFAHLDQFAGAARFATWLGRIAIHEAFARTKLARRFVELAEADEPRDRLTPEDTVASREMVTVLEAALDQLSDIHSSVFVLREIEGLSTAETAEALDVSEEVVKVRLHRAKHELREAVFAHAGGAAAQVFSLHASRCDRVVAAVMRRLTSRLT
jgi:RNA polymerase sigma-70 factor (ECF subfamily)